MTTEQFFHELELRRTAAIVQRDMPVIEALHAPEYELVTAGGRVFSRERYLGLIAAQPFYAGWEATSEMTFRISADMAILRYQAKLLFPSGREVACWHTDSYERRGDVWQAVWSQATELKA
jgi:hypothetical protein